MAENKQVDATNEQVAPDKDYKQELKRLTCAWLENDIDLRQKSFEQKRTIGRCVAWIAGGIPIIMLAVLFGLILYPCSVFYQMGELPQTFLISASLLSFVVIYAILVKGMFHRPTEEDGGSFPTKEVVENIVDRVQDKQ